MRSLAVRWAVSSHCAAKACHSSNDGYRIGLAFLDFFTHSEPTDLRSLITRIPYRVIGDGEEPTLLLCDAKNVVVNPIFQAKSKRPPLRDFRRERPVLSKKSRAASSQNSAQPIGNVFFGLKDRASPETELLPVDVLIAGFLKAPPWYPPSFPVGANKSRFLKSGSRTPHRLNEGLLQSQILGGFRGTSANCEARRRLILDNFGEGVIGSEALILHSPINDRAQDADTLSIHPTVERSLFRATLCCSLNNLSDSRWPRKSLRKRERHANRGLKSWVQEQPRTRGNLFVFKRASVCRTANGDGPKPKKEGRVSWLSAGNTLRFRDGIPGETWTWMTSTHTPSQRTTGSA